MGTCIFANMHNCTCKCSKKC